MPSNRKNSETLITALNNLLQEIASEQDSQRTINDLLNSLLTENNTNLLNVISAINSNTFDTTSLEQQISGSSSLNNNNLLNTIAAINALATQNNTNLSNVITAVNSSINPFIEYVNQFFDLSLGVTSNKFDTQKYKFINIELYYLNVNAVDAEVSFFSEASGGQTLGTQARKEVIPVGGINNKVVLDQTTGFHHIQFKDFPYDTLILEFTPNTATLGTSSVYILARN